MTKTNKILANIFKPILSFASLALFTTMVLAPPTKVSAASQAEYNALASFTCTQTNPTANDACADRIRVDYEPTTTEINNYCFRSGQSSSQGGNCSANFNQPPPSSPPTSDARYFGDELEQLAAGACTATNSTQRNACINDIIENGATQSQIETYCAASRSNDAAITFCINNFETSSGQAPPSGGDSGSNPGVSPNPPSTPSSPGVDSCAGGNCPDPATIRTDEGGVDTSQQTLGGQRDTEDCDTELNGEECLQNLKIFEILNAVLEFMVIIMIPVITIVIIVGGVQYSMATGDPSKVSAAKARITNGVVALASFIFLWSFLQWLIPGGAF